jgi:hypothetical protein
MPLWHMASGSENFKDASKNLAQDWMKAQLIDTEIANFQVSNYPLVNIQKTMENHHF